MNKIQEILPTVYLETANKYISVKQEQCQLKNLRYKNQIVKIMVKAATENLIGLILVVATGVFFFMRSNNGHRQLFNK